MSIEPKAAYTSSHGRIVVVFDLRDPRAVERLHQERAVWQGRSDIEGLDDDHFVLVDRIGRPGSVDADCGTSTTTGDQRGW